MFPDTSLIPPAIYSNSQPELEFPFAREYLGLPVNEAAVHRTQGFSSININNHFSFGVAAPFGIHTFKPLGLELTAPSAPSFNKVVQGSPFVRDDSAAGIDASISSLCMPEGSGLDLPIERVRPLVFEPSSGASIPEMEVPLNNRFLGMEIASSTSSSSLANRSAGQRRNGAASTSTMAGEQASTQNAAASKTADGRVFCSYKGCSKAYCDASTMRRHVIECHLKLGPKCPGCGKKLSRKESLRRHLDNEVTYAACREAALANGWEEVERIRGHRFCRISSSCYVAFLRTPPPRSSHSSLLSVSLPSL